MSQAGHLSVSASPTVATSYTTNNGTAIPDLNILQVDADDVTDNNVNGIQTTGGLVEAGASNRVQVELTNRLQGTASITENVTGDVITFDLGSSAAVYRFEFRVTGRDTGNGDGVGYSVWASARTDGIASTIIQSPNIDADEDISLIAALIDVVASGNDIILQPTGVTGRTISYSAIGLYTVI